jgi:hypothetical protein
MKKIGLIIGMACFIALASCSNSKVESTDTTDTVVSEVEVPVETENSSSTTTTTTTRTNDDGTTVEVDQNGIVVGSKDGNSETKVKVTTDSTRVKIKR